MPNSPGSIISILSSFATIFPSLRTWTNALTLLVGAVLCRGGRTVCAALRVMGMKGEKSYDKYHKILNRVSWDTLAGAKILLNKAVAGISGTIFIAIDEHIERRGGAKIKAKGCYRDPVRSSKKNIVKCFGLKWISMTVLRSFSWGTRVFSLPFMTVLAPSEAANQKAGKTHKTTIDWAVQMVKQVRRWLPDSSIILTADGGFANASLAWTCIKENIALVSRLRMDARLFALPGRYSGRGRRPTKGERLVTPRTMLDMANIPWTVLNVGWYTGRRRDVLIATFTCVWHVIGHTPIPLRVVLVKDSAGEYEPAVLMCTNVATSVENVIKAYVDRWNQEVTHREVREHLGVETQRQWSDRAVARTTPVLFGLYTLVLLMADALNSVQPLQVSRTAWYRKTHVTFSDALTAVRRVLWESLHFQRFLSEVDPMEIHLRKELEALLGLLAEAA